MGELQKKTSEFIEKIGEDWDKIPNLVKFSLLSGSLILLSIWLVGPNYISNHTNSLLLWVLGGAVLFLLVVPLAYWTYELTYLWRLRRKYPLSELGKSIMFLQVAGAVCLVQEGKHMHIRWIENPRTLYDLGFSIYWSDFIHKKSFKDLLSSGYRIRYGIRTRRIPGSLKKRDS